MAMKRGSLALNDLANVPSIIWSDRNDSEDMDGHAILAAAGRQYLRPWRKCIKEDDLRHDHLPSYYRRLTDEQAGHLFAHVMHQKSLPVKDLSEYWPANFNKQGVPLQDEFKAAVQIRRRPTWTSAYLLQHKLA